jgi:hypothetical protein
MCLVNWFGRATIGRRHGRAAADRENRDPSHGITLHYAHRDGTAQTFDE